MEPCVSCSVLSHLLYGIICVKIFIMNQNRKGIFSRATQGAGILLTDNMQNGGSSNVNYY